MLFDTDRTVIRAADTQAYTVVLSCAQGITVYTIYNFVFSFKKI